jgi:hypothetical protein
MLPGKILQADAAVTWQKLADVAIFALQKFTSILFTSPVYMTKCIHLTFTRSNTLAKNIKFSPVLNIIYHLVYITFTTILLSGTGTKIVQVRCVLRLNHYQVLVLSTSTSTTYSKLNGSAGTRNASTRALVPVYPSKPFLSTVTGIKQ